MSVFADEIRSLIQKHTDDILQVLDFACVQTNLALLVFSCALANLGYHIGVAFRTFLHQ